MAINMKETIKNEKIKQILKIAHENEGYITTQQLTKNKIHREYLNEMIKMDLIKKLLRGVYILKETKPDILYALTLKNSKIIFSEQTSLYLLGYQNNLSKIDITVDLNYHDESLNKNYHVIKCSKQILHIGLEKVKTKTSKEVNCYNIERTICDLIKFKKRIEFKIIKQTLNNYIKKEKNYDKLYEYAKQLKIEKELKRIIKLHTEEKNGEL